MGLKPNLLPKWQHRYHYWQSVGHRQCAGVIAAVHWLRISLVLSGDGVSVEGKTIVNVTDQACHLEDSCTEKF